MHVSNTILLLGGTTEAYNLAERLDQKQIAFLTSLAGRTSKPRIPAGRFRIGGFGGVEGLIETLQKEQIGLIIDATHPFAQTMTDHAWRAAEATSIPYLRLERPLWQAERDDNWLMVEHLHEAVPMIPRDCSCFLALGRQYLKSFSVRKDVSFVARMIEPAENADEFANLEIIYDRPKTFDEELAFLEERRFNIMVCRNSGGQLSFGKLLAARQLGLPVIMQTRKALPNVPYLTSVDETMRFISHFLSQRL
ncbi:cobalt-precorrin-6A reductase [Bartonella sp. LJL80]